jgi:hypothetical protein
MLLRLSTIILLSAVVPQKCDFSGDAARKAETQIRPYFPNAQAILMPGGRTLRTITCVNLGPKAVESMQPTLDEKVKELKSPLARMMTGIHTFELGFEDSILRLDLATGRYSVVPAPIAVGYSGQYDTSCKGIIRVPTEAQIYVGRFKVSVQTANNQAQVVETIDTLGIYRPEEFNSVRDAEIEARRRIMGSELRKRGLTVVGIELVSVGRIPAPETPTWEFTPAAELDLRLPVN